MGLFTRIYDKFTHYAFSDCDCELCPYFISKKRGCSRIDDECCCVEEKVLALIFECGMSREDAYCFVTDNRGVVAGGGKSCGDEDGCRGSYDTDSMVSMVSIDIVARAATSTALPVPA